jgi:spore germination protein GerM
VTASADERPRRRRRHRAPVRAAATLAVLLVLAAVSACGLSTNDEPETIKDNVPPDLLGTGTADTGTQAGSTTTGPGTAETETVEIWFLETDALGNARVVMRPRQVPRPATQIQVLETLITEPPTELERLRGISTDIPEDATVTDTPRLRSDDGVLIVNLSDEFYDLQGETARNAFAQIVYTATELPNVLRVQFERDGEVFNAVDGEGQSSREPLGRGSFANLAPETTDADPADAPGPSGEGAEAASSPSSSPTGAAAR